RQRREPPALARLDLYREHAAEYEAGREPSFVDVGPALYLALDGAGALGAAEFQEATAVLYNIAFAIKMRRKAAGQDHAVAGLEAVWPEGPDAPRWRLLIRVPEYVRNEDIEQARELVGRSGAAAVRLERLDEGRRVPVLPGGPYAEIPATIRRMHAFAEAHGFRFCGVHHQLYVSDPRRVPPPRLRTLLRQPACPESGSWRSASPRTEQPGSVDTPPRNG